MIENGNAGHSKCKVVTHERCQSALVASCNDCTPIQIPQSHNLKLCKKESKKKFCAACQDGLEVPCFECEACAYCIHIHCRKNLTHNCKITSSFTSIIPKKFIRQNHHWIKEHLPVNLVCEVCKKNLSNMDSLNGLRCSWCLNTVHTNCVSQLNPEFLICDFGSLYNLVLPPYAVKQFSSDCLSYKPMLDIIDMDCVCCIFESDMNNLISWKSVSFTKDSTVADVLIAAIESFHKTDDCSSYYLTGINMCDSETDLHDDEIFSKIYPSPYQQIFLRRKWINSETKIKVHTGNINACRSSVDVIIKPQSTINDLIEVTLKNLSLKDKKPEDYSIVKVKLKSNLGSNDLLVQNYFQYNERSYNELIDKETLKKYKLYLQPKKEPMSEYSLFIGNLPVDLTHNEYQALLSDQLGGWEKDMCIKAAFPVSGGLVMSFNSVETYDKLSSKMRRLTINGKRLFSSFLPEIWDEYVSRSTTPLLVLVNSKSGGGQGEKLLNSFKQLLNPYQVVDLLEGGPLPALYMFRNLPEFKILICGGDGTFGWVLSCLDQISSKHLKCKQPASALLPLGTGNDLSRVLNWGAGYKDEPPLSILQWIEKAEPELFDRWNIVFDNSDDSNLNRDPVKLVPMNNYFSIGIDAEMCLEFHEAREEHPEKFSSRIHNKGVYFKAGIRKLAKNDMADLQRKLVLKVDGKEYKLPTIQGLAFVNINSWGGGADPWGSKDPDEKFKVPSYSDSILEVVGFTGVYHMGKIKSGISTGIRIAQGEIINLELKTELPVQVDGEPWLQQKSNIFIRTTLNQAKMLVKRNEIRRRAYTSNPISPNKVDLKKQPSESGLLNQETSQNRSKSP